MTVVVGGTIPDADIPTLEKHGVARIFQPGVSTKEIIDFLQQAAQS